MKASWVVSKCSAFTLFILYSVYLVSDIRQSCIRVWVLFPGLLLFQIILRHENSEPYITQLRVQFAQVLGVFRPARCPGALDYWLEMVLRTSRCPVLVTTSRCAMTAFRCHVCVWNLFETIIVSSIGKLRLFFKGYVSVLNSMSMMMMIIKDESLIITHLCLHCCFYWWKKALYILVF